MQKFVYTDLFDKVFSTFDLNERTATLKDSSKFNEKSILYIVDASYGTYIYAQGHLFGVDFNIKELSEFISEQHELISKHDDEIHELNELISYTADELRNELTLIPSENIDISNNYISALGYTYNLENNYILVGMGSHAPVLQCTPADASDSYAEGRQTAIGNLACHAEGAFSIAKGVASHAEGQSTEAKGMRSHAEGYHTIATNNAEHAQGIYNISHENTIHSIGIGRYENDRKNALEVLNTGEVYINNIGNYDGSTLENSLTLLEVINSKVDTSTLIEDELVIAAHVASLQDDVSILKETINSKVDTSTLIEDELVIAAHVASLQDDVSILKETINSIIDLTNTGLIYDTSIEPNKMYMFGEKTELTINHLIAGLSGIVNEYMFQFTSSSTGNCSLNVPNTVKWLNNINILNNKLYMVSIENNLGLIGEWNNE